VVTEVGAPSSFATSVNVSCASALVPDDVVAEADALDGDVEPEELDAVEVLHAADTVVAPLPLLAGDELAESLLQPTPRTATAMAATAARRRKRVTTCAGVATSAGAARSSPCFPLMPRCARLTPPSPG
jgi:hypothetical protein